MDNKPDQSTLISYLYGELDEQETERIREYLKAHPDELKKMQEMASVLKMLDAVEDKEVITPPVFMDNPQSVQVWQSAYFKTIVGIAASLLLILVAGRFLGTEITMGQGELRISFGGAKVKETVSPPLAEKAVQQMIHAAVSQNNETLAANFKDEEKRRDAMEKRRDDMLRVSLDRNSKKVDDLIKTTSDASQEQLRTFVAGLQNENLHLMKDYFQLSSTEQKKYVEGLLVDFSKYLQEQRKQDLTLVQTRVNSIEKNSDSFKQETEQILASIISNTKVKKTSY